MLLVYNIQKVTYFVTSYFRRGTFGSVLKSELSKAVSCFGAKNRGNPDNGSANGGLNGNGNGINGSGYRYGRPSNGDAKPLKNGHNFYQAQALLRKETAEDANSQL